MILTMKIITGMNLIMGYLIMDNRAEWIITLRETMTVGVGSVIMVIVTSLRVMTLREPLSSLSGYAIIHLQW